MSARATKSWRVTDIVTASVLAVAFGVLFWAWGLLWAAAGPAFVAFPPAQAVMYGVWLMPAVVAPLIIRKPGAALFTELVAATLSALLGSQWGVTTLVYGVTQGIAAEVVFLVTGYRVFNKSVAVIAGASAGVAAAILDRALFYPEWNAVWTSSYVVLVALSAAAIAGWYGYLLVWRLRKAGALEGFA